MHVVFVDVQTFSLVIKYFLWNLKIMLGGLLFWSVFPILVGAEKPSHEQGFVAYDWNSRVFQ
jgi:hypothetical protein